MEDFKYDVRPQMRIALQEIGSADLTAKWLCGNFETRNTSVNERERRSPWLQPRPYGSFDVVKRDYCIR